jgi:hypothetical protein
VADPVVERRGNRIDVAVGSSYEQIEPETWTPAEARAFAARIVAASDETESAERAVRELCAREGHAWGEGYDAWQSFADAVKVHLRHCERDGCDARTEEPGWRSEWPAKRHLRPGGFQVDCYGPGCPDCEAAELAEAVRPLLAAAMARLEDQAWPTS